VTDHDPLRSTTLPRACHCPPMLVAVHDPLRSTPLPVACHCPPMPVAVHDLLRSTPHTLAWHEPPSRFPRADLVRGSPYPPPCPSAYTSVSRETHSHSSTRPISRRSFTAPRRYSSCIGAIQLRKSRPFLVKEASMAQSPLIVHVTHGQAGTSAEPGYARAAGNGPRERALSPWSSGRDGNTCERRFEPSSSFVTIDEPV